MGAGGGKCERPCSGVDSARYLGATVRGSPQSPISLFEQLRRASLQSLFNEPMMASHTFLLFSGRRIVFRRSLCLFWKDHFQPLSRPLVALVGEIEEFSLRFFRSIFVAMRGLMKNPGTIANLMRNHHRASIPTKLRQLSALFSNRAMASPLRASVRL
jgi:hypothetical protein